MPAQQTHAAPLSPPAPPPAPAPDAPSRPPPDLSARLAQARAAIARYNALHTAYWHAAAAYTAPGADLIATSTALRAARATRDHARPLLLGILARAQQAARAAGQPWPACLVPAAPPPPVPLPPAAGSQPAAPPPGGPHPARKTARTPLPALVPLLPADPPPLLQAKSRLNRQIAEAQRLGKSGAWRPLKHARAALERLTAPAPRQIRIG